MQENNDYCQAKSVDILSSYKNNDNPSFLKPWEDEARETYDLITYDDLKENPGHAAEIRVKQRNVMYDISSLVNCMANKPKSVVYDGGMQIKF